ncbi:MAG: DUF3472 domain-containing protein [Eubacteriales bacterium]|nr:DUF3472 domain-containing protein [Eubacteriales bacterium]
MKRHIAVLLFVAVILTLPCFTTAFASEFWQSSNELAHLPYLYSPRDSEPFALVNDYGAFLSVANDHDTLVLSRTPCFWVLEEQLAGYEVCLEEDPELIFDLDNAYYAEGSKVHLFVYTGYECQNWLLEECEGAFLLVSAEKPEWCVLSREKGFCLGKRDLATGNDRWHIVEKGDWVNGFVSPIEAPLYRKEYVAFRYTPTPTFWETFDQCGITDEMKKESKHIKANYCAQYLCVDPQLTMTENRFDFFSVEFRTDKQPRDTYWSLVNWGMDNQEYISRKGYTHADSVGAYAGLQMVGKKAKGIMSMWETYFYKGGEKKKTLSATCVYPKGKSTHYDNEGSGTSLIVPFEWKANTWYRFVLRSWINKESDSTYVGSWVEDLSTGELYLLAVYDTHLPNSYMLGNMGQFLENFNGEQYWRHREMQLRNYCLHDPLTDEWYFPDSVTMSIWTELGFNQGSYRYSAADGVFTAETCGLGKNACKGMESWETAVTLSAEPAKSAPDMERYSTELP